MRAVDEQRHRAGGKRLLDAGAGGRQIEGGQPQHAFGGQPEPHLAGDDQLHCWRSIDQTRSQPADAVPQMLGVVEREQQIERPDGQSQRLERVAAAEPHAERFRDRCRQRRRVGDAGQLDPADAVRMGATARIEQVLHQQALADAAGAGHADQGVAVDQRAERGEVAGTTQQCRKGARQARLQGSGAGSAMAGASSAWPSTRAVKR